jgi:hypothetical protein
VVDRARVGQLEESVGFIHLLQICLQEPPCYDAPKHDKSSFGITGRASRHNGSKRRRFHHLDHLGAGTSETRNPTLASIENPVGQTLLKVGRLWSIIATYPSTVLSSPPAIP